MYPKKITLHVGMPKAGSTSIQEFLFRNRKHLLGESVLYPEKGLFGQGHSELGHLALPRKILKTAPMPAPGVISENTRPRWGQFRHHRGMVVLSRKERLHKLRSYCETILDECAKREVDRLVLSAESFYSIDRPNVPALLGSLGCRSAEIEVIVFFRRQDLWLESALRQKSKVNLVDVDDRYINRFMKQAQLDCVDNLVPWWKALSKGQVKVFPFPGIIGGETLERKFCEITGIHWLDSYTAIEVANEKLSRDCLAWLIENRETYTYGDGRFFRIASVLGKFTKRHPDPAIYRFYLSPERRRQILRDSEEKNRLLGEYCPIPEQRMFFRSSTDDIDDEWERYPGLDEARRGKIAAFVEKRMQCSDP